MEARVEKFWVVNKLEAINEQAAKPIRNLYQTLHCTG